MKNVIIIIFLFSSIIASATDYYVSSAGNDANNGLSPSTAWKTIAKVNASTFLQGDSILFNKGDTWRESLTIHNSGTSANYIVYSSYGTGNKPKIYGSTQAITWTNVSGNIWTSATTVSDPAGGSGGSIYFIDTNGNVIWGNPKKTYQSGFGNLTVEYDWTWYNNHLYILATTDPDLRYTAIEAGQLESGIVLNNKEYIEISGFEIRYWRYQGIAESYPPLHLHGLKVNNCEISYLSIKGGAGYGVNCTHSESLIKNNVIHDCGRRGVTINDWQTGTGLLVENITVENNTFYNGSHTTSVDIIAHGEQHSTITNIIIRRNLIYDSPTKSLSDGPLTTSIYASKQGSAGGSSVNHIYIYYNIIKGYTSGGINFDNVTYGYVYNNIFCSNNSVLTGISNYIMGVNVTDATGVGEADYIYIKNNIFYSLQDHLVNVYLAQIRMADGIEARHVEADYNLYYNQDVSVRLIQWGGVNYLPANWSSFKSASGQESHSLSPIDPKFVSVSDYHLRSESPVIDKGIGVGLTNDYDSHLINGMPDIGAFETNYTDALPVYLNSSVESATPALLEMTYNMSLANVVPSASAFVVQVNSVARTVTGVAVSGTKVSLTLSSPVVYGDIITVTYNKPATNPLQTAAGGQAATITAQTVTNNVGAVSPVYLNSVIENVAPSLLEMTYNMSLANIVPSASAFVVQVNSVARTVTGVAVSGTKVSLTLSSPVVYGDIITVTYNKPATNPLQTAAGGQAATITAQTVTNNVGAVSPVYLSSVIENVAPSLLEMTYNMSLANIVPSASAFVVQVNSVARTVTGVSVSGNKVSLTLASPDVYGDIITVTYNKPATNPLQTAAGGQAATITAQTVTNNVGAVSPVYLSSVIENVAPSLLEMTYNMSLANIVPSASAFVVQVNSVARTVTGVSVSGNKVSLTLASPAVYGDIITVTYNKPATNPLQTSAGGQAATITAQTVTNNVGAVSPVYLSSVIENVAPSLLEMTYNMSLANIVPSASAFVVQVNSVARIVTGVAVSGTKVSLTLSSPVVYGDIITVTYNKPATNPLQTAAGGQAATITAQTVTNNVGAVSPVYLSSVIENAAPSLLEMTYNMNLSNVVPSASVFVVQINSVARTVTGVSVSGNKVSLTLASPAVYGDIITVTYNKPATNPLQTAAGGQAATITAQTVTNNVGAVSPAYLSSVIENAAPSLLEMTYNMSLANVVPSASAFVVQVNSVARTVTGVSVSGNKVSLTLSSPVVYGDIITVTYNKPATNPLQTAAGGLAATITAQTVTNNVGAVSPVYLSSVIENAAPSLLEMTYNMNLSNVVPSASAFVVQVNSVSRTVTGVAVSGTKVLLTLSSPVVYGDILTVTYNKPAANALQTAAGGQAASITAQTVINNVGAVSPVYLSSVIENAAPSLLEMTYNMNLSSVVPSASAFVVQVNSVSRTVTGVAVSGTKVSLTLSSPVVYGNILTVAYNKPATNPLQTAAGGQAATITAQTVTNNVGAVSPVYLSSVIENAAPSLLEMTYNMNLSNVVPSASAFVVQVNSVARTVTGVAVSGTKVLLTLSSPVVYGNILTVAYNKPATNPLQTAAGGQAATITAQTVTNNVGAVSPVYLSSVIENAAPSLLEMTYNMSLANIVPSASAFVVQVNSVSRTVTGVAVSGTKVSLTLSSPVVYGNILTVAYNKPATNPLQTAAGGQAATITAQSVTNNVGAVSPVYLSSVIENAAPSLLGMNYNLSLTNVVPAVSAFVVQVNSVARTVTGVAVSGTKVLLTLSSPVVYGNVVTITYNKPAANALQTAAGGQAATIINQSVTNNCSPSTNLPPIISISSPARNSTFIAPATITIEATASDPDGTVSKVEFFNGSSRIGERTTPPYSFTIKDVAEGTYTFTAVVTDNLNLKTTSAAVAINVKSVPLFQNKPPVIKITKPLKGEKFAARSTINIAVDVTDPDGTISKVEYFAGTTKIGESTIAPFSFTFENATSGAYDIIGVASDNSSAKDTSSSVNIYVTPYANSDLINLFPNPNNGRFSIDILTALTNEKIGLTITNMTGKIVYKEILSNEVNSRQFDLSYLTSGVYILTITSNEIIVTKKFIKK